MKGAYSALVFCAHHGQPVLLTNEAALDFHGFGGIVVAFLKTHTENENKVSVNAYINIFIWDIYIFMIEQHEYFTLFQNMHSW